MDPNVTNVSAVPMNYTMYVSRDTAIESAQSRANANGAPVAVVTRDNFGGYRIVEDVEEYDELTERGSWQMFTIVDPGSADE